MSLDVSGYSEDIVKWAESRHGFYVRETKEPIVLTDIQKRILRHALQPDSDGHMSCETVLYSCPKKSGKSTMGAQVALWWSTNLRATNTIGIFMSSLIPSVNI